jgi:hypothetical protein
MAAFIAPEEVMKPIYIEEADPYPWPFNGDLKPSNTCIIVIGTILMIDDYFLYNVSIRFCPNL